MERRSPDHARVPNRLGNLPFCVSRFGPRPRARTIHWAQAGPPAGEIRFDGHAPAALLPPQLLDQQLLIRLSRQREKGIEAHELAHLQSVSPTLRMKAQSEHGLRLEPLEAVPRASTWHTGRG